MTPAEPSRSSDPMPSPEEKRRPRRRSLLEKIRFAWWSVEAFSNFTHFMIAWILPILAGYLLVFTANGVLNGWVNAYDINLAITSPWEAGAGIRAPWLAVLLSIAGWLIVPVVAGAVVGYAVNSSLQRRRAHDGSRRADERPTKGAPQVSGAHDVSREPPFLVIPSLRDRSVTTYFEVNNDFVDYFVGLHDGDWGVAEDHFAREVKYIVNHSDAVQPYDRQGDAMRLAVKDAVSVLLSLRAHDLGKAPSEGDFKPNSGHCPYCAGSNDSMVGDR